MLIWFLMAIALLVIGVLGVLGRRRYQSQPSNEHRHTPRKARPNRKRQSKRK